MSDEFRKPLRDESQNQNYDIVFWGAFAMLGLSLASIMFFANSSFESGYRLALETNARQLNQQAIVSSFAASAIDLPIQVELQEPATRPTTQPGTTIVQKTPEFAPVSPARFGGELDNDPAASQQVGINLGTGSSFSALGRRYNSLAESAPTLFASLNPRASIVETGEGIEAQLVAGPIKDVASAERLCEKITQRFNTDCTPSKFIGQPLN